MNIDEQLKNLTRIEKLEIIGRRCIDSILRITELEKENEKLKIHIKKLNDIISSKNRIINQLRNDSWDDVSCERDR